MDIITYLLSLIQSLYQQNCWLINFICRYIPLKQWAFDDSHSPKYQKFKIDELPLITDFRQGWTYKELIPYYENVMVRKSARSAAGQNAISRTAVPAPVVMPRNLSFTKTMAPKDSFSAKSAVQGSHRMKAASHL